MYRHHGMGLVFALCAPFAQADVDYRIDLHQPDHHLANVAIEFPTAPAGDFKVSLPTWRTGKYKLLPLADGIRQFKVTDADGQPLPWRKTSRSTWTVDLDRATEVQVSYLVHANELGDRSRHIDDTHAYLDASGIFMYSPEFRHQPLSVELEVPKGWRSVSGMASDGDHRFVADNYDVLVDSPIETGEHHFQSFTVDGKDYELLIWGEGNYDAEAMARDLKALVAEGGAYFGHDYPFDRYVFMVHATTGVRGATEHLNSTVIQRPRWSFAKREDYLSFISTASHEFVHTWNVKAYRPQGLVPYDYQSENYTSLLWLAEGGTSYLQNIWLVRAGVMTTDEYLENLAKRLVRHLDTPGREQQSVAQSSFDNWIARGGDYGTNHSVSIYSEGYLANWALDLWLRDNDKDTGIGAIHRALYQDHRLPKGYSESRLKTLLSKHGGRDVGTMWQATIDSPLALDVDAMLAKLGLKLDLGEKTKLDLGLSLAKGGNDISRVRRDGPGWQAGLTKGDQLVAIDGQRFDPAKWEQTLAQYQPGQEVTVTVFRRDRLMARKLVLGSQPKDKPKLVAVENASGGQKAMFEAWLGVEWPFEYAQ